MNNLISTCYVVLEIASVVPVIYLRPVAITKFQKVETFTNPFEAKQFILANSNPGVSITVKKRAA